MIEGGVIMLLVGIALTFAQPVTKTMAHRRYHREVLMSMELTSVFPIPAPDPELESLLAAAAQAVEDFEAQETAHRRD